MTKAEKHAYVEALTTQLRTLKAAVVTEYRGTSVAQMEQLRTQLHAQGISYKVAKNTLLKRALEQVGLTMEDESLLDQPIALATSDDEVAVAKAIAAANKEIETIVPVAGIMNQEFVPVSVIQRLAKLPSREQLYSHLVGGLASLPGRMVRTIANPMTGLVTALNQIKAQATSKSG